jgi:hypothetical protein
MAWGKTEEGGTGWVGPGSGPIGMAWVDTEGAGCAGGGPDLRVCPGTFKTTIMLIIVRDSSIRTFLLFIIFSILLFVFSRRQQVLAFGLSAHKLRAEPILCYGV